MVAIQNLWRLLEKKDVHGCADITDSDHILKDQFINGLKANPVWRTLQDNFEAMSTTSFHIAVADAVVLLCRQ